MTSFESYNSTNFTQNHINFTYDFENPINPKIVLSDAFFSFGSSNNNNATETLINSSENCTNLEILGFDTGVEWSCKPFLLRLWHGYLMYLLVGAIVAIIGGCCACCMWVCKYVQICCMVKEGLGLAKDVAEKAGEVQGAVADRIMNGPRGHGGGRGRHRNYYYDDYYDDSHRGRGGGRSHHNNNNRGRSHSPRRQNRHQAYDYYYDF